MRTAITIAVQELRYWARTKLSISVALLGLILICISVLATFHQVTKEKNIRESLQFSAEQTFRDQPARHHGAQAGPFSRLTPALTYQLLIPLILIVLGFSVVSREREAATDRQLITSGISPISVWLGKTLALASVALLLMLPMLIGISFSGANWLIGLGFSVLYSAYLALWVIIITAISTWSQRSSVSLFGLLSIWLIICILLPRLIASVSSVAVENASRIETDMEVILALRSVGDGHNANDPAFSKLKANLLNKYGVDKVENLPVNFRGVVAQVAETKLTDILNEYAEKRIATHREQTQFVQSFMFSSPFIALQSASMIVAGTDGETHHRFLREAESVRFQFVQDLNKVHEHQMAYLDDINRSRDVNAEQRTRVDPENWRVLSDFRFKADPTQIRLERSIGRFMVIVIWIIIFIIIGLLGARRLPEVNNA